MMFQIVSGWEGGPVYDIKLPQSRGRHGTIPCFPLRLLYGMHHPED